MRFIGSSSIWLDRSSDLPKIREEIELTVTRVLAEPTCNGRVVSSDCQERHRSVSYDVCGIIRRDARKRKVGIELLIVGLLPCIVMKERK